MQSKTVLVTGASSGIGQDLCKIFAEAGYDLIITARSKEPLEVLAQELKLLYQTKTTIILKDLSTKNGAKELYQEILDQNIHIKTLVNNAGFGVIGLFQDTELEFEEQMMQVNMTSLTILTKLFAQDMIAQGGGRILNVASIAGFQPGPLMAVYYATKAYVVSFSEALRDELTNTGVSVTTLCPGPVHTGFQKVAGINEEKLFSGKNLTFMDSQEVAEEGYQGLMRAKGIVIPGLLNKLSVSFGRFVPRSWAPKIVHLIQKKLK